MRPFKKFLFSLAVLGMLTVLASACETVSGYDSATATGTTNGVKWDALIRERMQWISSYTPYSSDVPLPKLVFVTQAEMNRIHNKRDRTTYAPDDDSLYAMYDTESGELFLPIGFNPTGKDDDVLTHEVGHHLQAKNNARFRCEADAEMEAYRIQNLYATKNGRETVNINPVVFACNGYLD
ncbi:MAG: hypothetical protein HYT27_03620 [Parcubacteria group bacterium]|nr:hypothetical protein [Parcubacteria group bacterium]